MSVHRYLLADLLTGQINYELPFYGVWYTRRINKPGNATFSMNLSNEGFSDQDIIDNTIPGRTAIWIERDGRLTWGGIIWSRTYQSDSHSLQYSAQTFESYFYEQFIETDFTRTNTDQREVLRQLIQNMQGKASANVRIQLPGVYSGGTLRSVTFRGYEGWTYGKAIEYMIGLGSGFDYTLDVNYDSNDVPTVSLNTADVLGLPIDQTQLTFDYPGNIKKYWYPENASGAVTSMLGFGGNQGTSMVRSKYTMQDLLDAGYPDLQDTYNNKDVTDTVTLAGQTREAGIKARVPVVVPTFELNADVDPSFGDYSLGDNAKVNITDPRFPSGVQFTTRIIGWDVTPTGNGTEDVKLVIAGGE